MTQVAQFLTLATMNTTLDANSMELRVRNLPPALNKRLAHIALEEGIPKNDVIVKALHEWVAQHPVRINGLKATK